MAWIEASFFDLVSLLFCILLIAVFIKQSHMNSNWKHKLKTLWLWVNFSSSFFLLFSLLTAVKFQRTTKERTIQNCGPLSFSLSLSHTCMTHIYGSSLSLISCPSQGTLFFVQHGNNFHRLCHWNMQVILFVATAIFRST